MPEEPKSRAEVAEYLEKEIERTLRVARKSGVSQALILILERARDEARANKGPKPN
jgi:hypothetical protein